jgi:hypothetical protein
MLAATVLVWLGATYVMGTLYAYVRVRQIVLLEDTRMTAKATMLSFVGDSPARVQLGNAGLRFSEHPISALLLAMAWPPICALYLLACRKEIKALVLEQPLCAECAKMPPLPPPSELAEDRAQAVLRGYAAGTGNDDELAKRILDDAKRYTASLKKGD